MNSIGNFPLDGDGVVQNLFNYLWCKDEQNCGPSINIPDTIVYMYCQPAYWYFTSVKGQIMRKNRHNLTAKNIEEVFLKKAPVATEIVAYFISQASGKSQESVIEYFSAKTLHDFLHNRPKVQNGILQRFIQPKGVKNHMVRSIWSPKVCLLERRMNIRKLHDKRFSLYERAVTFEGNEINCETTPIRGAFLPNKVQVVNETIVQHVAEVSFHKHKISRMVLNFKVDPSDKLWLLWCSSIRQQNADSMKDRAVNIELNVQVPKNIALAAGRGYGAPLCVEKDFQCPSCVSFVDSTRTYDVNYKTVISHFDQIMADYHDGYIDTGDLTGLSGMTWADIERRSVPLEIPPVVSKLHPQLALEDYQRYKRDPLFLYKTAKVCEECYLVYADVQTYDVQGPVLVPSLTDTHGFKPGRRGEQSLNRMETAKKLAQYQLEKEAKKAAAAEAKRGRGRKKKTQSGGGGGATKKKEADSLDEMMGFNTLMNTVKKPDLESFERIEDAASMKRPETDGEAAAAYQEEQFFREVYRRPKFPEGGPLLHMLHTQEDLANTPTLSKPKKNKSAKSGSMDDRLAAYTTTIELPDKPRKRGVSGRRTRRSSSLRNAGSAAVGGVGGPKGNSGTGGEGDVVDADPTTAELEAQQQDFYRQSAEEHREFLLETLKQVKEQLQQPSSLLEATDTTGEMEGEEVN
eukprot:INCI6144.1.p1 GENE.INCI6144.1~~INCI6144.1.p1  ORF type:complete len:687 (+),score=132.26 INCI6144.1:298-2358(+)